MSALRALQEVQEKLLACLKMAFNNSGGLRPRDVPKSLRVAILLVRPSPAARPPARPPAFALHRFQGAAALRS